MKEEEGEGWGGLHVISHAGVTLKRRRVCKVAR